MGESRQKVMWRVLNTLADGMDWADTSQSLIIQFWVVGSVPKTLKGIEFFFRPSFLVFYALQRGFKLRERMKAG
jgi:hypothetical protein